MTTPDEARRQAAYDKATERGLISTCSGAVVTGQPVPTRDRPAMPQPAATAGRRPSSAAPARQFKSSTVGISDAAARANTLAGRIRSSMPFKATAAERERVTREVTAAFNKEYS